MALLRNMLHLEHMLAVGTPYVQTRINRARHWRDCTAGTMMLYHPSNYRKTIPIQRMTTGRTDLLMDGRRPHYRSQQTRAGWLEQLADEAKVI